MSVLDDGPRIADVDRSDMLGVAEAAADHWRDGVARARAADLSFLPDHTALSGVIVCGMGGSGVAGDVAAATVAARGGLPVWVAKGFALPAFAGPHSLVVAVSYSGSTDETLSCFDQAHARGAQVVVIATGGRLGEIAREHGYPWIQPAAGMQPRAAFPYLAAAVLVVLERLGALPDLTGDIVEVDEVLHEQTARVRRGTPAAGNPAKTIAAALGSSLPVVWGQDGHLAVAAARWKTQLNENAKVLAYASSLPELDHNEVVGLGPGSPDPTNVSFVALRTATEDPRMTRRIDATLALARSRGAAALEAQVHGVGALAQLASAVQLGDLVSLYLAVIRGVDPTPVEAITRLKSEVT